MKVRARVKAREYWPEWTRCCPEMQEHVEKAHTIVPGEFTVDLSKQIPWPSKVCRFCGADLPALPSADLVGIGLVVIDWLDLDEGAAH